MRGRLVFTAAVVACLAISNVARAELDYLFTNGGADVANGQLRTDGSGNVWGGFIDVTGASNPVLDGVYNVYPIPVTAFPNTITSPDGAFYVDNVLYPSGNAPVIPAQAYVDNNGLLFENGSGIFLNLYGNGSGDYAMLVNNGGYQGDSTGVTMTLTPTVLPTPEPASLAVWGLGIAAAALLMTRRRRKA